MTYPDGSVLSVQYDPTFTFGVTPGSRISRPLGLQLGSTEIVSYRYIGLHNVAAVDYPVPDVLLDRSLAFDGSRTTGQYPGFDRFGRIARQTWADGTIAAGSGNGAGYPTKPPIVSLGYTYDKAGNITDKFDARPGVLRAHDFQYTYDELHRLAEAKKGLGHGTNFALGSGGGSQQWNLSVIGNWNEFDTDLNADGQYQSTHDKLVGGTFNLANEITQLDQHDPNGYTGTLAVTYDKAGNLREQGIGTNAKLRFTHDAWNRLVKVQYVDTGTNPETVVARGEYEYNGLHQRCIKRCDHDTSDLTTGLDEQRLLYYSAGWQVLEERIDDAWTSGGGHTTDRIVQHIWGLRYIDDLVLTRQDYDHNGDYANNRSDYTHYALSDHQFSVVAMIDSSAKLLERVDYTPNGAARHQFYNDIDGDGDVDANDTSLASSASGSTIGQSNYNVDADFDRDGDVDSNDTVLAGSTYYKSALPAGWISSTGNAFGYCGYRFNQETGLYNVRFRNFDPMNGRWLERDPAGYVDSMSLYGYGWGSPSTGSDFLGLYRFSRDPEEDRRIKNDIPELQPYLHSLHESAEWAAPRFEALGILLITPGLMLLPGPDDLIIAGVIAGAGKVLKALRLIANRLRGLRGEREVIRALEDAGFKVVGRRVRVRTPFGIREIDIVVQHGDEFWGIEVKTGNAVRDAEQILKDRWINRHGAETTGRWKEIIPEIDGTITIHWDCNRGCANGVCQGE